VFVVKDLGAADAAPGLRDELLDLLLASRYRLLDALAGGPVAGVDPVRQLFLDTWEQLRAIVRRAARTGGLRDHALRYASFLAAGDALAALDAAGPGLDIEISADGLRRLARVLVPGGGAVIAVPFLHRADGPTDRHRFTEVSLLELVERSGLRVLSLSAQARFFGTLANHLRQAVANIRSRPVRWLTAAPTLPLSALLIALDGLGPVRRSAFLASYATGFVALARKG